MNNQTLFSLFAVSFTALVLVGCSKTVEPPAAPQTTSVGVEVDDSVITAKVKSALLGDPDIKGFEFKVETRKGEVQLSGFVETQSQINHAIAIASRVPGVKRIENNVSLKGSAATLGNRIDDSIITTQVKSALLSDANIKSFDIGVITLKGEVQLSGFVDNQSQIDRAIQVATAIEGVQRVSNQMSIKK